ncbi:MAG TPA: hypothetical protein PLV31_01495 [Gammaproteobacteria bacterium]|nr:hypothetical protein [Gammaproteobacteria bacterium]HRB44145.1 hypothetical protein [Niabella sp.]HRB60514.1 hypothetical protein [Niabella sp.]HRC03204.1 hypothetical protein [Niabella sp.]
MEESLKWIKGAIESCTNGFHLQGCDRLIELFKNQYKFQEAIETLQCLRQKKAIELWVEV